eukprot:scaffold197101_cov33-Tisochrysis_lutea.AAC.5
MVMGVAGGERSAPAPSGEVPVPAFLLCLWWWCRVTRSWSSVKPCRGLMSQSFLPFQASLPLRSAVLAPH